MSELSDSARVTLLIADFANTDGSGKLNVIGGGVSLTAIDSSTGHCAPLAVVAGVSVSPRFVGHNFTLEIALYRDDGELVVAPGTPGGAIRVAQAVSVAPVVNPGSYIPERSVWSSNQMILNFNNGLPLAAGGSYEWRVSIDGSAEPHWRAGLYVIGANPLTIG